MSNSTTVLTLHNKESESITELLGALAVAGFTVITAAPSDLCVSHSCVVQNVSTVIIDYPYEVLEEAVKVLRVYRQDIPIIWLSESLDMDCTKTVGDVEVTCIKLPIKPSVLLSVVEWLSKSFAAYQQVVRVSMSIETVKSAIGDRHGYQKNIT